MPAKAAHRINSPDPKQSLGTQDWGETFSGVYLDPEGFVQLSMVKGTSEIQDEVALLTATSATPILQTLVSHSFDQLEGALSTLVSEQDALAAQGLVIQSAWPDPRTNSDEVILADTSKIPSGVDPGAWGSKLLGQYVDSGLLTVADTTAPLEVAGSRDHDLSPFNGADGISLSQFNSGCTAGFAVVDRSSGHTFLLSDGHSGGGTVTARRGPRFG